MVGMTGGCGKGDEDGDKTRRLRAVMGDHQE